MLCELIFVIKLISLLYFISSGLFNDAANSSVVAWINTRVWV